MERRAKIVATLGPASADRRVLARLLRAGADVVRLNLSHGDHEQHRRLLRAVREVAAAQDRHVPVLADLMGPRYRLGTLAGGPRRLRRGERVELGDESAGADLPVDRPDLLTHLRRGERILVDNGLVELEVEAKRGRKVRARVVAGGEVSTRKGINLPDTDLPFTISDKDRADVAFAVAEGVDYLGASYVGTAADLAALRRLAEESGACPPLVAKLERAAAIDHLDEILGETDALMVARGDLGVEVPIDRVPVLQKRILAAARRRGTPAVVATQMLESMMERPRPTRAEATDVANAVLDGADALMLSGETAAGRYPVAAVETMARVIEEAERYQREAGGGAGLGGPDAGAGAEGDARSGTAEPRLRIADVVCAAAAHAAGQLGAASIVAFSQGGFTARSIARYRPAVPIRVFTTDPGVARQVQLLWGVRPLLMEREAASLERVVEVVERRLRTARLALRGEFIVLVMGDPIHQRPLTNLLRIHRLQ